MISIECRPYRLRSRDLSGRFGYPDVEINNGARDEEDDVCGVSRYITLWLWIRIDVKTLQTVALNN